MPLAPALLAAALAASPAAAPPAPAPSLPLPRLPPADALREMDALLARAYPDDEPGAAVIVVRRGEVLLRRARGLADVAAGAPVSPGTPFPIGSITKGFTALALALLAQDGRLSLDDRLSSRLPGWRAPNGDPTLAQLLAHVSGVDSTAPGHPLAFPPGTAYRYGNDAYLLAAEVVARASGEPWATFVQERILGPAGLAATGLEARPGLAKGYVRGERGWAPAAPIDGAAHGAAGGLASTVDDLARLEGALLAGRLLPRPALDRLRATVALPDGTPLHAGLGWALGELLGGPTAEHGGTVDGFAAYQLAVPSEQVFVAVLTNREAGEPLPAAVAAGLAMLALGVRPPAPVAVPVPQATLDAYAGTYGSPGAPRHVRRAGDGLELERPAQDGRPPLVRRLVPVGPDTFECPALPRVRLTFERGPVPGPRSGARADAPEARGAITALRVRQQAGPDDVLPRVR
ncbi:MAG: serine hydrolase domain-containing protein [Anaeromyxobacteraceae bacterium]